ncbi:MAG: hypothetical protein M1838_003082 [Thelocarpon superellum]|nr:MAG: hypothetical protein M1838_003082 [Thelocarpon superellum]
MSVNNDATKEARRVVEEIAGDNGVFTPERRALETPASLRTIDNLKGIALAAAQKLAGDLYDKPTHFILESIQNADDNAYAPGVLPKLRLYHSVGCIWMDCNELGFEEAHVRALCNVGKSTKGSGKGRQEGYIGEKGIGFKSIFKVAERVHINSPPYSFDLDGSREMGMITPRWVVPDPEPSLSRMGYQTQLTLLPPDGKDFRSLADAFREIRPTLLIFLRRLKSIEVTVSPCFGVAAFHTSYTTTWASDSESVTIDALEMGLAGKRQERRKYLVVKDRFGRLPKEPLRTDINSTEVVLAFPVDEDANLVDETQSVHAFLPVRDIGLKFVVQADFLLTSNRQDVHGASPWNLRLRECVVSTFVKAMARFREAEGLRHTWIRYLPDDGAEDFWGGLKNGILEKIKSQPVLLSRDGRLAVPNALKSIEAGFLDSTFISPRYSPGDVHILERLGVGTLGRWRGLIRHLNAWDPAEFASRSEAWHEDFADVYFRQSIFQRQTLAPDLLPLPLIPLEGGSWARSSRYNGGGAIYFRGPPGLREIPADVKLRLVDAKASQHNSRRELFKAMGVTECRVGDVASLIFTMHESPSPPPFAKAIAHVRYIFGHESARDDPRSAQLWLFDSNWSAVKGPALYLDTDAGPFSPFRLFNKQQSSRFAARFLHGDYNVPQEEKVRWTRWLKESLRVQTIPKLGDGDQISADFAFILKEWPQHVLELLRTHWGIYRLLMTIGIRRAIEKFEADTEKKDFPCWHSHILRRVLLVGQKLRLGCSGRLHGQKGPQINVWRR